MRKVAGFFKERAERFERLAGIVALLMATVSFSLSIYQQAQEGSRTLCQFTINQQFLATLKQRAVIGKDNTDNINTLIREVFSTKDPKVALQDYQNYLTRLESINGELSKATYPNFSSC